MYKPKGVVIAFRILGKSSKFLVYYDPDIDGLVSGSIAQRFLREGGFNSEYYINQNRGHGFKISDEDIDKLKGYTIIAVDFSMGQEEFEKLTSRGINVICIDHHHVNDKGSPLYVKHENGCEAILINNQYSFEPEEWRFLSGAGMVFYALGSIYPPMLEDDELKALVGLTLLSDIREIENDNAKYFLDYTFDTNLDSNLIKYFLDITKPEKDYGFGEVVFDRNFIDYVFSPKLNALLRFNKTVEAVMLINGALDLEYSKYLQDFRDMQKKIIDGIIDGCSDLLELDNLNLKYIYGDAFYYGDYDVSNFIGVACSKIREFTGKTTVVIVLNRDNTIRRGSLRGNFDNVDYLGIFRGEHVVCAGHKGAFGIISMNGDEDFKLISDTIGICEQEAFTNQYEGRIKNVNNLKLFVDTMGGVVCRDMAHKNNYLRDSKRIYIKYTGENVKRYQKGKMWEYDIDGIKVKCFDEELNLENGLILPLEERGYIQFYLRRE